MKLLLLLFLIVNFGFGQSSIKNEDIEIYTQLTLLNVKKKDKNDFKNYLKKLADRAKEFKINYEYDWLTYESEKGEFLIVNFSDDLESILTLNDYRNVFSDANSSQLFDVTIQGLQSLNIDVKFNYTKEMILPWSTVAEMSVSEFPYAEMIEYNTNTQSLEKLNNVLRKFSRLLLEANFPFPLESSRGSLGAYGKITLVWFYDDPANFESEKTLQNWMKKHGKLEEYNALRNDIQILTTVSKTFRLSYQKELSN